MSRATGEPQTAEKLGQDQELATRVSAAVEEAGIKTVIVGGPDLYGVFRGKRVPATRFGRSPDGPLEFSDYMFAIDLQEQAVIPREPNFNGWWPSWDTGFGDVLGSPDLSTFRICPWLESTAVVLCDWAFADGGPVPIAPRHVLSRVLERARSLGLVPQMAAELEFMVYRETPASLRAKGFREPEPLFEDPAAYGIQRSSLDEDVIGAVRDQVEAFGIPLQSSNAEGGAGQYEVNLVHGCLPEAADDAFLFKHAVKEIVGSQGMTASFMAKTSLDYGSSLHVHQSLWTEGGDNVFYDTDAEAQMSTAARAFIAGQLATLREFDCVFAPNTNSYRRFQPDTAAGTTATWGIDNRTTGLRTISHDASSCRVEHRRAGADANLHLVMAAALAGGLYGIENGLEPPAATAVSAYTDPSAEPLPTDLGTATSEFENGAIAREYLGDAFVDYYAATRRWELEQARLTPTDWEMRRFLERA